MSLVEQVMTQEPYAGAKRVFWIVDNGSSHRSQRSIDRLAAARCALHSVHLQSIATNNWPSLR
ncbi:hypothetical protein [Streptomyces sp. MMG1533]|uniref:hypothetical protein n=1 Tax=Streptomyces sp. MMG1533 TaxID=1415546 RepID=UPI001F169151|nr:hypothetical protein [Streptomyces sp. MMG1533]